MYRTVLLGRALGALKRGGDGRREGVVMSNEFNVVVVALILIEVIINVCIGATRKYSPTRETTKSTLP